jgi:hypothetical protein
VFVLLGGSTSQANQPPNTSVLGAQSELVEELRDRVAFLEREMKRRGDETERLHQIVAGLAQANAEQARTIRAIEAPATQEPPEDAETVEEGPEDTESPGPATGGPQTGPQRPQREPITLRSLRRRIFGR